MVQAFDAGRETYHFCSSKDDPVSDMALARSRPQDVEGT